MRQGLQASEVIKTLERLQRRIAERFPDAGLPNVCADLVEVAHTISARARRVAAPYLLLRLAITAVVVAALGAPLWAATHMDWRTLRLSPDFVALTQGAESAVNLVILAGAAIWFLMSLEERLKRRRAMADLHELRSFAHVVDMHQLTKDPTVILAPAARTPASPVRGMTRFQLTRYLEYCAEMLALIGKLSALYAEYTRDPQVVAAVNDLESLCTDLGRKVWQKITILSALEEEQQGAA